MTSNYDAQAVYLYARERGIDKYDDQSSICDAVGI